MNQQHKNNYSQLLVLSALASSIGSFLFGFDTAVIAGTTASLETVFGLNKTQLGFTVSSALIGALIGAALVGVPCQKFGRVKTLFVLAVFYLVSALGCAYSNDITSLVVFRVIGGIAVGGASVVSPMYITEITPPKSRGVLVAIAQLNIVAGILAALFSNYLIVGQFGTELTSDAWRWMFGVEAVPATLFILSVLFIPESPRWLAGKGETDKAKSILGRLGYRDPEAEMLIISQSFAQKNQLRHSIFQRRYCKALALVCGLAILNQLDGINAILYYVTDIFKMAGFAAEDAFLQSVTVGGANLIFTIVGMILIDRMGRKQLLLMGSITFVAFHALAAYVFLTESNGMLAVVAAAGIVGSHAFSQGAVIWVCINELLPNSVRAAGSSLACFVLWGVAILVSSYFPSLMEKFGGYVFVAFAIMMIIQFVLVLIFLPETKGKSLEEIEAEIKLS